MAQSKNTTNFEGLLFQFMDSPDPMLSMLEWLCSRMMEAEVSSKIGADKHEQSQERTSHRCGFRYCQIKFATLDSVYHVTLPVYPVI